jgi:hypothetical protein
MRRIVKQPDRGIDLDPDGEETTIRLDRPRRYTRSEAGKLCLQSCLPRTTNRRQSHVRIPSYLNPSNKTPGMGNG